MTIPKLPPPPRRAQNRSAFSVAVAFTTVPSAVTISAPIRLSHVKPSLRSSQPLPLPSASPTMPVSGTRPPVTASPCSCVAASNSPQLSPASARTVRASGSTAIAFMPRMSIIRPSSITAAPVTLCPPPYTEIGRPWARANFTAATTSSVLPHTAISAGRRSIMALKTARASSYRPSPGRSCSPPKPGMPRSVALVAMVPSLRSSSLQSTHLRSPRVPDHQGRHPEFTEGADDPNTTPAPYPWCSGRRPSTAARRAPERPDIGEAADVTGAPVGRRVFLGLVGVGAAGVLLGARAQDWLERVGRTAHLQGRHRPRVAAPGRPLPHLHRHRRPPVAQPRRLVVEGRRSRRPPVRALLRRAGRDAGHRPHPRLPVRDRLARARRAMERRADLAPARPRRRAGRSRPRCGSTRSTASTPRASPSRRRDATT